MGERAMTLRGWTNLRHVSVAVIARQIGVHRNTVMGWLRGQNEPSFLHGCALSRALGLTPDALELAVKASLRAHQESLRAAGKDSPRPSHPMATHSSMPRTAAAKRSAAYPLGVG